MSGRPQWEPGMRVELVEHVDATRQPRENGRVIPGEVTEVTSLYVIVRHELSRRPDPFFADSGWRAWDGMFSWRLRPAVTP